MFKFPKLQKWSNDKSQSKDYLLEYGWFFILSCCLYISQTWLLFFIHGCEFRFHLHKNPSGLKVLGHFHRTISHVFEAKYHHAKSLSIYFQKWPTVLFFITECGKEDCYRLLEVLSAHCWTPAFRFQISVYDIKPLFDKEKFAFRARRAA